MNAQRLLTIGYQGREIDEFLGYLKDLMVTRLVDVREIPLSRKRGYSKTALRQRLSDEDIEYVHMKALGSPAVARKRLKADHNYDKFFATYNKHLAKHPDAISELHRYTFEGVTCLMCFEKVAQECHRHVVAQRVKEYNGNGLQIRHV